MFVETAIKNAVHPSTAVILVNSAFWPMTPEVTALAFPLSVVGPALVAAGRVLAAAFVLAFSLSLWSAQGSLLCVQETWT